MQSEETGEEDAMLRIAAGTFISALCFVPGFPVKGYAGILCCVLIVMSALNYGN